MTNDEKMFKFCRWINKFLLVSYAEGKQHSETIEAIKGRGFYNPICLNDLSKTSCIQLGFEYWDEKRDLLLIPFWLLPFLEEEFKGSFIGDETFVENIKVNQNEDHRFGFLPYGLVFE